MTARQGEERMKNRKARTAVFILQILLCLALNWGGDRLISRLNWPIWLDSAGTVLSAYLLGPVCGAIVGITSNMLAHILYGTPWFYAAVSVLIALITGYAAKKKMLDTLLGTMTVSAALAGAVAAAAYPINLLLNGGSTGNSWGDAVIGFLGEIGMPRWLGLIIGELYVELIDKLAILLVLLALTKVIRKLKQHRGPEEPKPRGKRKAMRAAALILAVAAAGAGVTPAGAARAEDKGGAMHYNDYVQTIYSTTNGLPCGEANDIAMTGDGILWVGTYAGLYRYNGREFRWMDGYDSVRNVNCLYVDEEGRLWVGTNDNGLTIIINEEVVNVIDQARGLPANSVKSIIKSADGYYYIGTTGSMQILTLSGGMKRIGILHEVVYADHLAADRNGFVAAVDNEGTLFLMRQGQIVSSRKLYGRNEVFRSCEFDQDGVLHAATTGNEILRFRIGMNGFEPLSSLTCPGLQNIKNIRFMENGEMFICADNGIAYLDAAGQYELINTNDFNNSIDNMLVDYQGNLWFTSSRLGLLRMAPSDFRDIYSTAGMDNRVVNTIVQWNGAYYFGTDKGMDAVDLTGKQRIEDDVTARFQGVRIRCMIVDRNDHLWVCTYSEGLVEMTPDGQEYQYSKENGAFGNRARVVKELEDGTILAAGDTGLSFIRNHQIEDTIDRSEGRISSMVLSITEMADGSILVGTDGNGLAILRDRKVEHLMTRTDGLSSEVILRTVADSKTGGAFLVTSNGLCYMNTDHTIRTLDNFPYYNNYDIWIRGTDKLFVLSSAGIYIVDRTELLSGKDEIKYELLNTQRGLNGSLTANAWTWFSEESSELYLPCDTGVFVINTDSFSSATRVYRMKVDGIRLDGNNQHTERGQTTVIPRGVSRVELMPEVINYTIQDPFVGYRLEGFDEGWTIVPQNALGTVRYTNLPAGKYTFHLAVFDNSQEQILAERVYTLEKEKELYDNSWFILYILSVPMFTVFWVTWLLVRRRERRIEEALEQANRQIEMGKQTVAAIARTVDAKDERTRKHSDRVAQYSRQIAEYCGMSEKQCQDIEYAAQMHDIGKIAIPDAILNKQGKLEDWEYATMKTHTTKGAKILEGFTLLDNVIEGAEFHHERYDGRGYPKGLKGEEIPLFARIIGVADAFDAMTAARIYRQQMDFDYVLSELEKGRGTQFDPKYVDALLALIRNGTIDIRKIYRKDIANAEKAAERAAGEARKAEEEKNAATGGNKEAGEAPEAGGKPAEEGEKPAAGETPKDGAHQAEGGKPKAGQTPKDGETRAAGKGGRP